MDNRAIGVFDSGLGGLIAAELLRRRLPREDIIYFGDTGRMPYGGRPEQELMTICRQDIDFLLSFDVKLILSACGTTSTVALPAIKASVPVPVFGVIEPAAKIVCERSKNGRVAVIATAATITGGAFRRALLNLRPELEIWEAACPRFVPLIESGRFRPDDPLVSEAVGEYLSGIARADVDTMLLGCTHYPLIGAAISSYMGSGVELVDAGSAAADELINYISANDLSAGETHTGSASYYTSGDAANFRETANLILGLRLEHGLSSVEPFPL